MGLFQKIKKLFVKEDSPLPSSDDFISSDSKDVSKILQELGLEEARASGGAPTKSPKVDVKPNPKNNPKPSNIGSLFFEEGEVDLDELNEKSRLEAQRTTDGIGDKNSSSKEAFKEKIQEKIQQTGSKLKEKGKEVKEKMDSFLDDIEKRSAKLDEVEKLEREKHSGPLEYKGKSLLDDQDDFFEKAKAFADGRPSPPKGMSIEKTEPDQSNKKDNRKVYGFEDLDGDGDEIIDDAIVEEE